jgi:hypothetical protein
MNSRPGQWRTDTGTRGAGRPWPHWKAPLSIWVTAAFAIAGNPMPGGYVAIAYLYSRENEAGPTPPAPLHRPGRSPMKGGVQQGLGAANATRRRTNSAAIDGRRS